LIKTLLLLAPIRRFLIKRREYTGPEEVEKEAAQVAASSH
jgi:hypothetical protein